jgi:hypothetical protein
MAETRSKRPPLLRPALAAIAFLLTVSPLFAQARFVYQGRLEESGEPARRSYDLVFRLYDHREGGVQVGPSLSTKDLPVVDGSFAVDLDFGPAQPAGELWLEVAVRGVGEAEYEALSPRQRLAGTPYAVLAQGGKWSLIGVPVGAPDAPASGGVCRQPEKMSESEDPIPMPGQAMFFNSSAHTITANASGPFGNQIRIGFSNLANFSDIKVGVGTLTPQATFHVDQPKVPNNGEAARITFRNLNNLQNATGLRILESQSKTTTGQHQGLAATTSATAGGQSGQSSGSVAESSAFFAQGTFLGVTGRSTPNQLNNFDATKSSLGLGGRFLSQPTSPLNLSNTGNYFVGGAYGEVAGQINGNPGGGAVAGVIGIDRNTGTAPSWAGYFAGRGHFSNDVGVGTTAPTARLDVAGTARVRTLTGTPAATLVTATANGTLGGLALTGNANDVLRGNGTFGPASGTADNDWVGAGSGQMVAGFTTDRVAIGTTGAAAKFAVVSTLESPAAFVRFDPDPSNAFPVGLWSTVVGTATGTGFGGLFQASGSNANVNNNALRAETPGIGKINQAVEANASNAAFRNTGVWATATGNASSTFNIGVRAEGTGGQAAYGIFATASGGSSANWAGGFQGDIEVTGTIHNPSDRRLKTDIEDLDGALAILGALEPRSFVYRREEYPDLFLPKGRHFGLIAQEMETILPELVAETVRPEVSEHGAEARQPRTYKTVSYLELVPVLVRGIQEQQALLDGQEARIRQLEAERAATGSQLEALSRRLAELEARQR